MTGKKQLIVEVMQRIAGLPQFAQYATAIKAANKAAPQDIPRADGQLKHAEKQLREAIAKSGISARELDGLMAAITKQLRK